MLPSSLKVVIIGRQARSSPLASAGVVYGDLLVRPIEPRSQWFRGHLLRQLATQAIDEDRFELIHLVDADLAPLGVELGRRLGVPVTAAVTRDDLHGAADRRRRWLRSLEQLDAVFVDDALTHRVLREHAPHADVTLLPIGAVPLPAAGARSDRAVARALVGTEPGAFVLAAPVCLPPLGFRAFIDDVTAGLEVAPACVVFGIPPAASRRDRNRVFERVRPVRIVRAPIDPDLTAAVARYADAFVVPSGCCGELALDAERRLMLASSGVPVIAPVDASVPDVLRHEENAILVDGLRGGWSAALNGLFALPSLQRQALGEQFAARSFQLFPVSAAQRAYEARFAALLGRPQIPLELRAA